MVRQLSTLNFLIGRSTFALFRQILDVAEQLTPQGIKALDSFNFGLMHKPMPAKGSSIYLDVYFDRDEDEDEDRVFVLHICQ